MERRRAKSKEQIKKENLKRVYDKLKIEVANKEEVWLELFEAFIPLLIGEEIGNVAPEVLEHRVRLARRLSDVALEQYEDRWGSVSK